MSDATYTKADLDKAIADAVAKAEEPLKAKRDELMDEVKSIKNELRKSREIDPAEVAKLEEENDKLRTELTKAQADAKKATADLEKATKQLEGETGFTSKLLKENALNAALAEIGVTDPDYLAAAKSMMAPGASVVTEGEERVVKVGDKTLADHVKEWGASDAAKKFISAGGNNGGGAPGGNGGSGGGKTMTRKEYNERAVSDPAGTRSFLLDGGTIVDDAA